MKDNNDTPINLKSYIGITGMPDEIFESGWIEYSGDLVMRYTPGKVRRLLDMLEKSKEILEQDKQLEEIKGDFDYSLEFFENVVKTVYDDIEKNRHE